MRLMKSAIAPPSAIAAQITKFCNFDAFVFIVYFKMVNSAAKIDYLHDKKFILHVFRFILRVKNFTLGVFFYSACIFRAIFINNAIIPA